MRSFVPLLALLFGGALPCGCTGTMTPHRPTQRGFRLPPRRCVIPHVDRGLRLFAPVGHIRVRPSNDAYLEKRLTISAESSEEANSIGKGCQIRVTKGADGLTVLKHAVPVDFPIARVGVDSTLALPARLILDLRTRSGLIDTTQYAATVATLATESGTLLVGPVLGQLEFDAGRGRVELRGAFQEAHGVATDGSVLCRLDKSARRLRLVSRGGDLTLVAPQGVAALIRYRTVSGDWDVTPAGSVAVVESTHGDGRRWGDTVLRIGPPQANATDIRFESETGNLTIRCSNSASQPGPQSSR